MSVNEIRKLLITLAAAVLMCLVCGFSVSARASGFGYTVNKNTLTVFVSDGGEGAYKLSLDGGRSYMQTSMPYTFHYIPDGIYQLRVKYPDGSLSEVKAAVVGKSGIPAGNEIFADITGYAEETLGSGEIRISIRNFDSSATYLLSADGGRSWKPAAGKESVISGLYSGEYTVDIRRTDDPHISSRSLEITVPAKRTADSVILKVPLIKQLPELPTGCEVTSLSMALNFYGIKISKTVLADVFLEKGEYRAADYRKVFVGDPREIKAYGCYSDVLVNCAEKFLETIKTRSFDVINVTGCSMEALYGYVDMGYPVIVWTTNKMLPTFEGPSWIDADTGETITWVGNEHCVLLTGFDRNKKVVYLNDPLYGITAFKMSDFELRFYELEQQAIVISETTDS